MKHILIILLILAVMICVNYQVYGQNTAILDKNVNYLRVDAVNLPAAVAQVAKKFEVTIGFEDTSKDTLGNQFREFKNQTLRQVLDSIIHQSNSKYDWKLKENWVYIFPKEDRNTLLKEILETQINEFCITKNASKIDVRNELTNLLEVKEFLSKHNLKAANITAISANTKQSNGQYEFRSKDKSLMQTLSDFSSKSKTYFWFIGVFGENYNLFTINI